MDEKFSWADAVYLLLILYGAVLALGNFTEGRWALGVFWLFYSLAFGEILASRHSEALGVSRFRARFRLSIGLVLIASMAVVALLAFEWPWVLAASVAWGALCLVSVVRGRRSSGGADR